jgi:hypothetical protein
MDSALLVCVGGGSIGSDAARLGKDRNWSVVVIDRDQNCQAKCMADEVRHWPVEDEIWKKGRITLVVGEATEVLLDIIEKRIPDHVVPGTSGHLLAKFSVSFLRRSGLILMPDGKASAEVARRFPDEIILVNDPKNGLIVVSRMPSEGVCPDGCQQPIKCPVTRTVLIPPMDEIIRDAIRGYTDGEMVAVTSWFGPYGALKGDTFANALDLLREVNEGELLGVATSCRCHGIINFLRAFKKS